MEVDYQLAFDLAPVGLVLSRNRSIIDCNQHLCEMFGADKAQLVGQSFKVLYPSAAEYERIGARMLPILNARGMYADDRIMKPPGGRDVLVPRHGPHAQPGASARGGHLDF
jgi:PAS domain-containing protein